MPSFETIIDRQKRETVARIMNEHEDDVVIKRSSEVFMDEDGYTTVVGTLRTNQSSLTRVEAREKSRPLFVYDVHTNEGDTYLFGPIGRKTPRNPDEICKAEMEARVLGAFSHVAEMDDRRRPIRIAYEEIPDSEADAVMDEILSTPRKLLDYPPEADVRDRRPRERDGFSFEDNT